jgi:hypothetical protein
MTLGTRMIVKGVLTKAPGARRMMNPNYQFATFQH